MSNPAKQERNPDGTWPEGVSGNPAGPPVGHFKISYWATRYLQGEDMSNCPPKALELVEAMHRDAVQRPGTVDKDGREHPSSGCPATRKLLWDRVEGLQVQEIKQDVSMAVRESVLVDPRLTDRPPEMPDVVRDVEKAEERARAEADKRREEALGSIGSASDVE